MIVLDTHVWVWWIHQSTHLTKSQVEIIEATETDFIGISAISAWETA